MQPKLVVHPKASLTDEAVTIHVHGLQPFQQVTIKAVAERDVGLFLSLANYTANDEGIIDLDKQAADGGFYSGIEPMGLFWSMRPAVEDSNRPNHLVRVKDVEKPFVVRFELYDSHFSYEDLGNSDKKIVATAFIKRWCKSPGVTRISVRWKRIRGTLFIPEGIGPFPALIDISGFRMGLKEHRASLLASRGYMSLALAHSQYDDLPKAGADLDLSYFEEAREFLKSRPECSRDKIGLIGISEGGFLALTCATYVPGFKCAVSIDGPVFSYFSNITYKGRRWNRTPPNIDLTYTEDGGSIGKYCFDQYYDVNSLGTSLVEFAECQAPLLFILGKHDNAVNVPKAISFINQLTQKSECNYKIATYPGAGHILDTPYWPLVKFIYQKKHSVFANYGGEPAEHARAQVHAWGEILDFLNQNLSNAPSKL